MPSTDEWNKVFMRDQDVMSRKIDGELFLVPVRGKLADMESIFTLTEVAEFIWERLDGRKSLNNIRSEVTAEFDVDDDRAGSDIRGFIAELLDSGLIHEAEAANEVL